MKNEITTINRNSAEQRRTNDAETVEKAMEHKMLKPLTGALKDEKTVLGALVFKATTEKSQAALRKSGNTVRVSISFWQERMRCGCISHRMLSRRILTRTVSGTTTSTVRMYPHT